MVLDFWFELCQLSSIAHPHRLCLHSCYSMRNLYGVSGSWFLPDQALAVAASYGLNQHMEDLLKYLFLSFLSSSLPPFLPSLLSISLFNFPFPYSLIHIITLKVFLNGLGKFGGWVLTLGVENVPRSGLQSTT